MRCRTAGQVACRDWEKMVSRVMKCRMAGHVACRDWEKMVRKCRMAGHVAYSDRRKGSWSGCRDDGKKQRRFGGGNRKIGRIARTSGGHSGRERGGL